MCEYLYLFCWNNTKGDTICSILKPHQEFLLILKVLFKGPVHVMLTSILEHLVFFLLIVLQNL